MFERFFKNRYGYSRWDGTQNIEGLEADDVLKALSDDYLENGNLQQAMRRLMQNGIPKDNGNKTMGLRELMERMREQRNQQLNRYNMASGVMDDLREKLEEIKQLEREGIQDRLDGAQNNQQQPSGEQANKGSNSNLLTSKDNSPNKAKGTAGSTRPAVFWWPGAGRSIRQRR